MDTLSPMMRTLGRVVENGFSAPDLQTERPTVSFAAAPTHTVAYVPESEHLVPAGQHVCWLGQHTAFSYGQQPSPFPEYMAAQTEPTWQTCALGAGAGVGTTGAGVQFS